MELLLNNVSFTLSFNAICNAIVRWKRCIRDYITSILCLSYYFIWWCKKLFI